MREIFLNDVYNDKVNAKKYEPLGFPRLTSPLQQSWKLPDNATADSTHLMRNILSETQTHISSENKVSVNHYGHSLRMTLQVLHSTGSAVNNQEETHCS
jgi:hypothetical protein